MSVFVIAIVANAALAGAALGRPTKEAWEADQKAAADKKAAGAADEAKMAAVNKVTDMLVDLQKQVLAEGEAEAETYNKFACWCKTTSKEKNEAITEGKDNKKALSALIKKKMSARDGEDDKIAKHKKNIDKANKFMKKITGERDETHAIFKKNAADLKSAIDSLNSAIKVLKASKTPSLLQVQSVSDTVKTAIEMADAMGLGSDSSRKQLAVFLQQPAAGDTVAVEMEDYKFHSGGVIDTLEKELLPDFIKEKDAIDAAEVKSVSVYDQTMQDRTDYVKDNEHDLDIAEKTKSKLIEEIEEASQELTVTSSTLLDDMEYLAELTDMCSKKAQTWDQRSKARANELTALTSALGIIKSTVADKTQSSTLRLAQTGVKITIPDAVANSDRALEVIEAEAEATEAEEGSALGFLQKRSIQKHDPNAATDYIINMLRGKGKELKSNLLTSLAQQMTGDPLAKVKKLIQELIERLLQEAANEANQKGWCDKAMADATQKRTYASEEIESLNAKMAKLEALSAKLDEEITTLIKEIKALNDEAAEATQERKEEKLENANTVTEAKAGLAAVQMAIDILDKFYKTNAKNKVEYSLAQGPMDDAPDAGFDNGEAYTGAGGAGVGIIGMMEVIEGDFERTISETMKTEKENQAEFDKFMTETKKSLAEKTMAKDQKIKLKDEADTNLDKANGDLVDQMTILKGTIEELIELKATCIDTGMSYEDRVAMREQEIASLKKALCIFGAYAEYGPDGLADKC